MAKTQKFDLDTDTTLGGSNASDYIAPSQKAIKTYVDNHSGSGGTATDVQINGTSITSNDVANIVTNSAYNASSNKIATMSDLPTIDSALSSTSTNPVQNKVINSALSNKYDASNPNGYTSNVGTVTKVNNTSPDSSGNVTLSIPAAQVNSDWNASSGVAQILNKPSLSTVATSGSYNDLSNKPTIPTVNNATLTIQKNGTTVKTFTANASSNVTANITVPTKTSDITNDSGYITGITSSDVTTALGYTPYNSTNPSGYQANVIETVKVNGTAQTVTSKAVDISVPTKVSQLTNDSGYTTNTGTVTSVNGVSPVNGNVTLSIPDAQVQSNWNETNTSSKAYIQNKPTIPSVGNGTITITQGGTTKGTFTTNQSSNATIDLDGGGGTPTDVQIDGSSITSNNIANILTESGYNSYSNKIATMLDVPPVDQTFNRTSVNPQSGLAIYNAKFLQNTATGTDALTIMGNPSNYSSSINIGYNSTSSNGGLAIGKGANANQGTAIGYNAQASGINSIQIGNGSNSTANSLQVGSYQLLNTSTGKIPYQRINTITDSNSGGGLKYWTGTRAQYNAITTKDANTLYNITDDSDITYSMLELLYPVGSIYIGTMATCPLATLGIGTWTLKTSRFLVEKYSDSSNWWELYSDGWCQQGGIVNVTSAPFSVDLLKSYANTNYSFFAFTADTYTGTSSRVVRGYSTNKTNSSFDIQYTSTAAGSTGNVTTEYVNWYACGYTSTVSQLNQWERVS